MENINQADEYRRLQELYAEMSDQKLEAISRQMEDLTDIAQEVLRAEIAKRGLDTRDLAVAEDPSEDPVEAARRALSAEISEQEADSRGEDTADQLDPFLGNHFPTGLDPAGYDMYCLGKETDASEARELMNVLEAAGFKPYLGPENVESVDDYHGSYKEGVEVKVMKFQAKYAIDELRRLAARKPQREPSEDENLFARCPKCNAADIVFESIDFEPGKEPGPDAKYTWSCEDCGHQWADDGIEKMA